MKKLLLCCLFAAIAAGAKGQNKGQIVIGKIDSIYSQILNEPRKIWIYTPDMTSPGSNQRYPVIYLLDGDAHFASVAGMVQQLSQVNGNNVLPQMIVVAIPNTNRTRDLTPTHINSDLPMMDSNASRATGGGEIFISFIEKELIPYVDTAYPTAPYRVLIGHSFGGLTVMNTLASHKNLFSAYIAIDPSMWYDKEKFLKTTMSQLEKGNFSGKRLFIGIANTLPAGTTLKKARSDTNADTRHIRSIFTLHEYLEGNKKNGLKYAGKYYSGDNHGTVPLITEYDGLRFIFDYYQLNLSLHDYIDSSGAVVDKLKKHYHVVSEEMGYKVAPDEQAINAFGYDAINRGFFNKAASLFQLNIENYPASGNVYDSYGDLFAAKKDTQNAILNYKKALAIQQLPQTQYKLGLMEGKNLYKPGEQELKMFEGVYDFDGLAVAATFWVKDGTLWAGVPGQEDSELVPLTPHVFTVKNKSGHTVAFEIRRNEAIGFTATQPNGLFKAKKRKQ